MVGVAVSQNILKKLRKFRDTAFNLKNKKTDLFEIRFWFASFIFLLFLYSLSLQAKTSCPDGHQNHNKQIKFGLL
jgi:hypothetical protein